MCPHSSRPPHGSVLCDGCHTVGLGGPARQNQLGFPILLGAKGKVSAAFGLCFKPPDYLIELISDNQGRVASPAFHLLRRSASKISTGAALAGNAGLAKMSRPDGCCILRHCAGVTPMRLLNARWNAASD